MIALLLGHPIALAALILGYALLVVEMCVPGFGVPGVLGILLSVTGLVLMGASPMQMLLLIAVFIVLLLIALAVCLRSISRGRLSRSRLVLHAVSTQSKVDGSGEADLRRFAGQSGFARTPLRPAGIAEIDGTRLNVVTEGDYIDADTPVLVARVEGNRVVVVRGA